MWTVEAILKKTTRRRGLAGRHADVPADAYRFEAGLCACLPAKPFSGGMPLENAAVVEPPAELND